MPPPTRRRFLTTARLLTALLGAVALADAVTRGLPITGLTFRPWEALIYYRPPGTAFEPLVRHEQWTYGDLANIGNLAEYRIYRRERWTTDAYGFRNPPDLAASGRVRAILIGDSFGGGAGLSDDETLAAQLGVRGLLTYNVAPMQLSAEGTGELAERLGMRDGWVVYQQASGLRYVHVDPGAITARPPAPQAPVTFTERLRRNLQTTTWPLRIAAERALKRWQDDRWFRNPYRHLVEPRRLANGDRMLFFRGERAESALSALATQAIDATVDLLGAYDRTLRARGLRLVVLLVPDRFAVYAHLIEDGGWQRQPWPYLTALEQRLEAAGVRVINAYDAMADRATSGAVSYEYLFWTDDTHWNAAGVSLAADLVVDYARRPSG